MTNKEREAIKALKWLVEHAKEEGLNHVDCVSVEALNLAINAIEERPTGEWIRHISSIECSVCKEKFFSADENENCQDYDPCLDFNFNYCPNCGAKMKGEAEND